MQLKFKINAVKANNVFLTRKVLKHFVDRMLETSMDEKKFQQALFALLSGQNAVESDFSVSMNCKQGLNKYTCKRREVQVNREGSTYETP